ncbi:SDR family oxidoreductase [Flavobacterium sp. MFBS3-15]|uniref:SDR family NAD(P)-dependent oxidoreductase n=1 Tax=Flavobacterium sp. MFBS3-15 TaxID=2989816 RepID=UPI00223691E1|nr:SDR family oxidoreductase [Flavobacterium sp. MFBS3-15]MCW4470697.1 SDR family oxidoreductase [Flavobacterium sp. MFBS3-15]
MKKIIITGTSRGIGYAMALQFAGAGHSVLAVSRKMPKELLDNPNITCLAADLSESAGAESIKNFIDSTWQHADIVIHNAGALLLKPFEQITADEFEYIYKVNVFGVAALNRVVLPYMKKGGHVVTISSMGGVQGTVKFSGLSAYSSSKGAATTLSELLAEEYNERGIAFNVLALGAVNTEMLREAFPGYEAPLSPAEMADYIYNFALTGNKYYNGKVLQVSSSTP